MNAKRKNLLIALCFYVALWIITGAFGLPQVDRAFDEEYAIGSRDGLESAARVVRASRVPYVRITDPSQQPIPEVPFRSRSVGIPIAPFLILDEICVAETPLAAFSGRRLIFWFFGYSRVFTLKVWWVS